MARTRTFDSDAVVEQAMQVFWAKGYTDTSVQDLVENTGLLKGSLYGAFGSKDNLFRLALQHYIARVRQSFIKDKDEAPLEYIRGFLADIIDEADRNRTHPGCFIMNTCVELSHDTDSELAKLAQSGLSAIEKNFAKALKKARQRDELQPGTNIDVLARRLLGAAFAMRQLSRFQPDRKLLTAIADGVLKDLGTAI